MQRNVLLWWGDRDVTGKIEKFAISFCCDRPCVAKSHGWVAGSALGDRPLLFIARRCVERCLAELDGQVFYKLLHPHYKYIVLGF